MNNWQLNRALAAATYPQPTNHHIDTTTEKLQELHIINNLWNNLEADIRSYNL